MIRCTFCDNLMRETDLNCPFCGTPHDPVRRSAPGAPQTIYELKNFANTIGISLERLHFHIGENYKGKCAFGIYKDEKTGNYVVYKNKDNGKRAVRYEGPDEAYAVYEIYQKLKERIALYKKNPNHDPVDLYREPSNNPLDKITPGMVGIFLLIFGTVCMILYVLMSVKVGFPANSGGSGSSTRYESSYDNDYDYSYSDRGSDSGDWNSDW